MKIFLYPPISIHEIGQRPTQEDAIAQWDNRLFVLCDGMGGHERGEVASQTVCLSLVKWFSENVKDDSFTDDQLREALEYAYTELDKFDDDSPKKMGTTLTLLYIHNPLAELNKISGSLWTTAERLTNTQFCVYTLSQGIVYLFLLQVLCFMLME